MPGGREELELFLDQGPSVRAAKAIDAAIEALGNTTSAIARKFDTSFDSAFDSAKRGAASAARSIGDHFEQAAKTAHARFGSIFSQVFSVAGGNLISGGIARLTGEFGEFFTTSAEGATELADAHLFLRSAVQETGRAYADAERQAKAFALQFGLGEGAADRLRGQAEIATKGLGVDPDEFLKKLADLAAARGRKPGELPTLLGQLFTSDESTDKLFGKNPSEIVNAYAKSIGVAASSLDSFGQKQAIINKVMEDGARFTGAASARLDSFAGTIEQIRTLADDAGARLFEKLGTNVGVRNIADSVRESLVKLVSDDHALDALAQKIANVFVDAAGRALDVGETVATVFNNAVGLFNKGQLVVEKFFVELDVSARTFTRNAEIQIVSLLERAVAFAGPTWDAIFRPVDEWLHDLSNRIGHALDAVPTSILDRIFGEGSREALDGLKEAIDGGVGGFSKLGGVIDDAQQGLERWRNQLNGSGAGIIELQRHVTKLEDEIADVDKATDASNASAKKFFDNLRAGLPAFREFATGPDSLDATGTAAEQAAGKVGLLAKEARAVADQFIALKTEGLGDESPLAAKFLSAFTAAENRVAAFKDKVKDLSDAVRGPLVDSFTTASDDLLSKTLGRLRAEVDETIRKIDEAENRFLGRSQFGPDGGDLRAALLAAQGLGPDGSFSGNIDPTAAGRKLLDLIDQQKLDVSSFSIDEQSLVARVRADLRAAVGGSELTALGLIGSRNSLAGSLEGPPTPPRDPALTKLEAVLDQIDPVALAGALSGIGALGSGGLEIRNRLDVRADREFTATVTDGAASDLLR